MQAPKQLTTHDIDHFIHHGYTVIKEGLDPHFCATRVTATLDHLGMKIDDPDTWEREKLHLPNLQTWSWQERAPRVYNAACDLLGQDRIATDAHFGDGMIINFRVGADRPWTPPGPDVKGWHKDGNFFRHFLDSPEQALLVIIVWKDIGPRAGGTFFAPDSIPHIARTLYQHPEGLKPGEIPTNDIIQRCTDFREVQANAGDVFLLHPYMLHSVSQNPSGSPRFITNPNIALQQPMRFDRPNPNHHSPLERSILHHLNATPPLDWHPTAPREHYQPGHLKAYEDFQKSRQKTT